MVYGYWFGLFSLISVADLCVRWFVVVLKVRLIADLVHVTCEREHTQLKYASQPSHLMQRFVSFWN